jgi:hypothetical protein
VLFVGRAQEKAWVFRTRKRRNPVTGKEYLWLTRATLQVNYFYFWQAAVSGSGASNPRSRRLEGDGPVLLSVAGHRVLPFGLVGARLFRRV